MNERGVPLDLSRLRSARRGDWIQCASGRPFWPLDPEPGDIDILDIAHALSNQCRFSGHVRTFLSVAQHSVAVARLCPSSDRLWGLLHDAAEAYLVDLPRPLKALPEFSPYRAAEAAVMRAVCVRFGLPEAMPESVHRADLAMLATEARDLMGDPVWGRMLGVEPIEAGIHCWGPERARTAFLALFRDLTTGR
jgi:uncharacterized protein